MKYRLRRFDPNNLDRLRSGNPSFEAIISLVFVIEASEILEAVVSKDCIATIVISAAIGYQPQISDWLEIDSLIDEAGKKLNGPIVAYMLDSIPGPGYPRGRRILMIGLAHEIKQDVLHKLMGSK